MSALVRLLTGFSTNPGQNDQANYEAIYTVGPILAKLKPRIVTLEQTYGLLTHEEHGKNFKPLMNDIYKAGYNARYKIQDMSDFGLPQRRKRLLIRKLLNAKISQARYTPPPLSKAHARPRRQRSEALCLGGRYPRTAEQT